MPQHAVMWSVYASALRKYVQLRDARRCKAAASLPSSLREADCQHMPSYKPVTRRSCYYSSSPYGWRDLRLRLSEWGWVMTLVKLSEFHLVVLKIMWFFFTECGSVFCSCSCKSAQIRIIKLCLCQRGSCFMSRLLTSQNYPAIIIQCLVKGWKKSFLIWCHNPKPEQITVISVLENVQHLKTSPLLFSLS